MTPGTAQHGSNERTLAAYEQGAQDYRARTATSPVDGSLVREVHALAPAGRILEIGSAHGRDALTFERLGRVVDRTDATQAFVQMLRTDGHEARVLNVITDPIPTEHGPYAAVFASAVFLHFTPAELDSALSKLRRVLAADGLLAFTVKAGDGSGWSEHKLGVPRFFQYWRPEPLRAAVESAGFDVLSTRVDATAAEVPDWIVLLARPRPPKEIHA